LPKKLKLLSNLPCKIEFLSEITFKNRNSSKICPEKSILLFVKLPEKNRNFSEIFLENQSF